MHLTDKSFKPRSNQELPMIVGKFCNFFTTGSMEAAFRVSGGFKVPADSVYTLCDSWALIRRHCVEDQL